MTRAAKASSECKEPSLTRRKEEPNRRIATSMLIARPISRLLHGSPDVGSSLGRARIAGEVIIFGPRSCHWQKRRHRKRCRQRRDGHGTWLSFGIARETGSITSVPVGEKENFADASPRVPARGPRRASLGKYTGRKPSLSPTRAAELRRRVADGDSKAALAREFGISRDTLYRYVPVKKRRAGKFGK
jgi:hypothetical protein